MTEREYIEKLRDAAADYIRAIEQNQRHAGPRAAARRWHTMRDNLSVFTMHDLCERWIQTSGEKK